MCQLVPLVLLPGEGETPGSLVREYHNIEVVYVCVVPGLNDQSEPIVSDIRPVCVDDPLIPVVLHSDDENFDLWELTFREGFGEGDFLSQKPVFVSVGVESLEVLSLRLLVEDYLTEFWVIESQPTQFSAEQVLPRLAAILYLETLSRHISHSSIVVIYPELKALLLGVGDQNLRSSLEGMLEFYLPDLIFAPSDRTQDLLALLEASILQGVPIPNRNNR